MKKLSFAIVIFSVMFGTIAYAARTVTWYIWRCSNCGYSVQTNSSTPPQYHMGQEMFGNDLPGATFAPRCGMTQSGMHNMVCDGTRQIVDPYGY